MGDQMLCKTKPLLPEDDAHEEQAPNWNQR
jgi:hypothetical protein